MEQGDWKAWADREAAAIVAGAMPHAGPVDYERLVSLVSIGWMCGVEVGMHRSLDKLGLSVDAARESV